MDDGTICEGDVSREEWLRKFGGHRHDVTPELFRGQWHDARFVDHLKKEVGREGGFYFPALAGFAPGMDVAYGFLKSSPLEEKYPFRVLNMFEQGSTARALYDSEFPDEQEYIVLPFMPLTIKEISTGPFLDNKGSLLQLELGKHPSTFVKKSFPMPYSDDNEGS